jgi:hypothetical protein
MTYRARILLVLVLATWLQPSLAQETASSIRVSLVQLLATPERFEGALVEVSGFLEVDFESTALYLHREDQENRLLANALWVGPSEPIETARKAIHLQYVTLAARFTSKKRGHMGLFPGSLESATWVMRQPGT